MSKTKRLSSNGPTNSNISVQQNGRRPPRAAPPSDTQTQSENVFEPQKSVCRKFLCGTCTRRTCWYRHELDLTEMRTRLKFCHDYQNQGCSRVDCTFLHASREEEKLYQASGTLPRLLLDRCADIANTSNNQSNSMRMPQKMFGLLPPPPPPALATAVKPPPPPPVNTSCFPQPPMYFGPPPSTPSTSALFTIKQPQLPLPVEFDATQPPPTPTSKRRMEPPEVGPSNSKSRKEDRTNLPDRPCENCIQRELRIGIYKKQMSKLHCEEECRSLIYKKKMEEYENGRKFLRTVVGPEIFKLLDDYIEGTLLTTQQNTSLPGMSTVPRKLLLQLMEYVARKETESNPSSSGLEDTTLMQTLLRISNSFAHPHAPGRVHTSVLQMLRSTTTIHGGSSAGNVDGVTLLSNGHKEGPMGPDMVNGDKSFPPPANASKGFLPPPHRQIGPPSPMYFPGAPPPPARLFGRPPIFGPTAHPPFSYLRYNSGRPNVPGSPQMTMPPPTSVAPPKYSQYMVARFPPPPHYYSSYK